MVSIHQDVSNGILMAVVDQMKPPVQPQWNFPYVHMGQNIEPTNSVPHMVIAVKFLYIVAMAMTYLRAEN